jgi:hypothetical protein
MDEVYTLPVSYNGAALEFPFRIVPQGYTIRYLVRVEETDLSFEKDDAGELRAIIVNPDEHKGRLPEQGLIAAIGAVFMQLLGE